MATFVVHFSDGTMHRLSVVSNDEMAQVERQVNKYGFSPFAPTNN